MSTILLTVGIVCLLFGGFILGRWSKSLWIIIALSVPLPCPAQPLSPNDPAFLQSTSPLRRGLVGYWRLEEASGTRYDCSHNGLHLTDNNSCGAVTAKVGYGFTLVKTSSQYLSASDTNIANFLKTQPFTVAAWCNLTNTGGDMFICGHYQATGASPNFRGWFIGTVGANAVPFIQIQSDSTHYCLVGGSTCLTNNVFRFVVATYDGTVSTNGCRLYVDNSLELNTMATDTGGLTDIDNVSNFCIGTRGDKTASVFSNGCIDELGIWNRVLTTGELTQLYNAGLGTHFPWAHP